MPTNEEFFSGTQPLEADDLSAPFVPKVEQQAEQTEVTETVETDNTTSQPEVEFDAFLNPDHPSRTGKPTPNEQPIKTEEEVETKVEDQVQPGEEVQPADQTAVTAKPVEHQGDVVLERYPTAAPFLKKMSKDAQQFVRAKLVELAEREEKEAELTTALTAAQAGRPQIPQSYYENQNGYVLLPEFQQASMATSIASKAFDHWSKQKRLALAGSEWYDLEEIKDPQGNVIDVRASNKPMPYSTDAQADIDDWHNGSMQQLQKLQGYRDNIARTFTGKVQAVLGNIKSAESELFPADRWDKEGTAENNYFKYAVKGLKELGLTEANPAFRLTAKLGAALIQARQTIASTQKGMQKVQAIAKDTRRAGPTGAATTSGGGNTTKVALGDDINDFNKILINR